MHWYNGYGAAYGGMVMMSLIGLLLVAGVVALVVMTTQRTPDDSGSAQRVLEARLARGEIDTEEFQRLRSLLRSR